MRPTILLTLLAAPLTILASPFPPLPYSDLNLLAPRQTVKKPKPCEPIVPAPNETETQARFDVFADAFIVKKNITAAFEFISQGYIVRSKSLSL